MSSKLRTKASEPNFFWEDQCSGSSCGLDEVGRGPLAGPVVAACVYIPLEKRTLDFIPRIRDSKKLSPKTLEELYTLISENFMFGIAECTVDEIDEINILQASFCAMRRAFDLCFSQNKIIAPKTMTALIDGHITPSFPCPARAVVKGDSKSVSIAAASILAKVTRDRIMGKLSLDHPHYGWEHNAGYPTPAHLNAIEQNGITPHHRKTYAPVRHFIEFGTVHRQMSLAV
ncbi:MAG: ribonuclease HII [Alphaproteobacteria bacterium]